MFDIGLILLIVVAIGIGWALGRYERVNSERKLSVIREGTGQVPKEYFQGLNYLLNEQPDQAVDLFAKTIDVNSDTVEIYLALGSNFRKRGEVDRAIKIHQDLLSRPNLERRPSVDIQYALCQDYLAAGLLDRAERMLVDLIDQESEHDSAATRLLINIYEQEKEWEKAIHRGALLKQQGDSTIALAMAHYHCELANRYVAAGDWAGARGELKKALSDDKRSVRASLILGQVELQAGAPAKALKALMQIRTQDPGYLHESVPLVAQCYEQLGRSAELLDYLQSCVEEWPDAALLVLLADYTQAQCGLDRAVQQVQDFMHQYPSLLALNWLIEHGRLSSATQIERYAQLLKHLTTDIVRKSYSYHCSSCGFTGNSLHWNCPSCKSWAAYKPHNPLASE